MGEERNGRARKMTSMRARKIASRQGRMMAGRRASEAAGKQVRGHEHTKSAQKTTNFKSAVVTKRTYLTEISKTGVSF